MQSKANGAGCDASRNETDDRKTQRVVLIHVLAIHPMHLRIPDLVRSVTAGSEELAETDAIERAIRDLTGAGLLDSPGGVVMATPAAIHADCLGVL
jgi:hypothetical protein